MKYIATKLSFLAAFLMIAGLAHAQDEMQAGAATQKCDSIFNVPKFSMDSTEQLYKCYMEENVTYEFRYAEDQENPVNVLLAIIPEERDYKGTPDRVINTTNMSAMHTCGKTGTYIIALHNGETSKEAKRLASYINDKAASTTSAAEDMMESAEDKADETVEDVKKKMTKEEKKAAKAAEKAAKKAEKARKKAEGK